MSHTKISSRETSVFPGGPGLPFSEKELRTKQIWQFSAEADWMLPDTQAELNESIKMDLRSSTKSKSSEQDDMKCWSLCSIPF